MEVSVSLPYAGHFTVCVAWAPPQCATAVLPIFLDLRLTARVGTFSEISVRDHLREHRTASRSQGLQQPLEHQPWRAQQRGGTT